MGHFIADREKLYLVFTSITTSSIQDASAGCCASVRPSYRKQKKTLRK